MSTKGKEKKGRESKKKTSSDGKKEQRETLLERLQKNNKDLQYSLWTLNVSGDIMMGSNVDDFPEQFVHVSKKVSATNGRSNAKGEGADRGVEKVTFEAGSQLIKLYLSNILLANESHPTFVELVEKFEGRRYLGKQERGRTICVCNLVSCIPEIPLRSALNLGRSWWRWRNSSYPRKGIMRS